MGETEGEAVQAAMVVRSQPAAAMVGRTHLQAPMGYTWPQAAMVVHSQMAAAVAVHMSLGLPLRH